MKNLVFCCMILMVFIIACEKTTSPGIESKIFGTVLGPDGNPVENAKILVNFHIDSEYPIGSKYQNGQKINEYYKAINDSIVPPINYGLYPNCPNPFSYMTGIWFCLDNASSISLCIEDILDNEIKQLVDGQVCHADLIYSIQWDGKNCDDENIQNGIYEALLITENKEYSDTLFVLMDYSDFSYEDITPLFVSDLSGGFSIQSNDLPLNYIGDQYDENGNPVGEFNVTPYVDIWAFHPNYDAVHVDSMLVESGKDVHVLLEFE